MTMVELVGEDGARERVGAVDPNDAAAPVDEFRRAAERLLAHAGSGREAAALLIAEALRLGARYGIRSASCVDGGIVVATAPAAFAAPSPERPAWVPAPMSDDVPVTDFGRVPGPYLARLADGVAFSISRRARRVVEVHPLTEGQARSAGFHDPTVVGDDVAVSQLMDNPSGVLRRIELDPGRVALLRKNNVVIGCLVPAAHPLLERALGDPPPRL